MYFLYKITNQINNKVYIGQAKQISKRWYRHKWCAKNPQYAKQYIHFALIKHGVENFIFEIIALSLTQEDANETETILIFQYDSCNPKFGYNIKPGGKTAPHSEQTKQKLREATSRYIKENGHPGLGTKRTPEQLERLSIALKNRKNYFTPEVLQRMSDAQKGKKQSEESIKKRVESFSKTILVRQEEEISKGEWKCHAPDCEISGIDGIKHHYIIYNGLRYCPKHGSRLKRNGTLETKPPHRTIGQEPPNKVKFTNEQIENIMNDPRPAVQVGKVFGVGRKVILRIRKENRIDKSVMMLTLEEKIAMGFYKCNAPNCDVEGQGNRYSYFDGIRYCAKHAKRLKTTGHLEPLPPKPPVNKIIFTAEQIKCIINDPRVADEIAKDFGVSKDVIYRVRKENNY